MCHPPQASRSSACANSARFARARARDTELADNETTATIANERDEFEARAADVRTSRFASRATTAPLSRGAERRLGFSLRPRLLARPRHRSLISALVIVLSSPRCCCCCSLVRRRARLFACAETARPSVRSIPFHSIPFHDITLYCITLPLARSRGDDPAVGHRRAARPRRPRPPRPRDHRDAARAPPGAPLRRPRGARRPANRTARGAVVAFSPSAPRPRDVAARAVPRRSSSCVWVGSVGARAIGRRAAVVGGSRESNTRADRRPTEPHPRVPHRARAPRAATQRAAPPSPRLSLRCRSA